MVVQEVIPPDLQNHVNYAQEMSESIPPKSMFFSSDEIHLHLSGAVIGVTHNKFTRDLPIPLKWLYGSHFKTSDYRRNMGEQ